MSHSTSFLALMAVDLMLVVAHLAGFALRGEPYELFDLDLEANVPTWYSGTKFAMAGLLISLQAVSKRSRSLMPVILAMLFLAMSIDEMASVHERVGQTLARSVFPAMEIRRKGAFLWPLLIGLPAIAVIAATFGVLRADHGLPPRMWRQTALGLGVFFTGAVGVELVTFNPVWPIEPGAVAYHGLVVCEELLEQVGASLLLHTSLLALQQRFGPFGEWMAHPTGESEEDVEPSGPG